MGFAWFLVGCVVGGSVAFIWRDELAELWNTWRSGQ